MKIKVVWICILFIFLTKCSSDDAASFDGITMMDEFANPVGEPDPTDWGIDEIWNSTELSLFSNVDGTKLNNNGEVIEPIDIDVLPQITPVYPNPSAGVIQFRIFEELEDGMVVIVDDRYKILVGPIDISSPVTLSFEFDVQSSTASFFQQSAPTSGTATVSEGQVVRLYYYLKRPNESVYFKGHGDILFQ